MANLSQRIRELRQRDKLSQQALADIIGISKSSINMYERGEREPGVETLEAFADYFNVDMNYLLGWADDPVDYENPELIASIPLSYMKLCDNDAEKAWKMMQVVDEDALAEFAQQKTPQSSDQGDLLDTSPATMNPGTDDKGYGLLAAYSENKDYLDESDTEDIELFIRMKAERKRAKDATSKDSE